MRSVRRSRAQGRCRQRGFDQGLRGAQGGSLLQSQQVAVGRHKAGGLPGSRGEVVAHHRKGHSAHRAACAVVGADALEVELLVPMPRVRACAQALCARAKQADSRPRVRRSGYLVGVPDSWPMVRWSCQLRCSHGATEGQARRRAQFTAVALGCMALSVGCAHVSGKSNLKSQDTSDMATRKSF